MSQEEQPWYEGGLRFACTQCGNCCTGEPGTVRVTDGEIATLATELELPAEQVRQQYTRRLADGGRSLKEKANLDCVFYHRQAGCTVYKARPRQCRTWPFWVQNLESPESWQAAGDGCPGIGRGPLHDLTEITAASRHDGTSNDPSR